jgi:CopG family nickel-responsive transcriptional regulator
MHRITISLDDPLAEALDGFLVSTGYRSRSEGVRDIVRDAMGRHNNDVVAHKHSVANLSYIYDRRVRRLASRLSEMQHAHHDLISSATSVPLDHSSSLESVMLKGPTVALREFADGVRSERGVRSLLLNLIGVDPGDRHEHAHDHSHTGHAHLSPTVS